MTNKWQNRYFSECASIVTESCKPTDIDTNTTCLGFKNVIKDKLRFDTVNKNTEAQSSKFKFNAGDILFARLDVESRKVIRPNFGGVCSTEFWVVRAKPGIDQGFLFYWMASRNFIKHAYGGVGGTTHPRANWKFMQEIKQPIPPETEQRNIALVFENLNKKIQLNIEMNRELTKITYQIFKHWFMDFEFPNEKNLPYKSNGGSFKIKNQIKIPNSKNWDVVPFENFGNLNKGLSYTSEEKSMNQRDELFITLNNISQVGNFKTEYSWIKSQRIKEKHRLSEDDLVLANVHFGVGGADISRLLANPALVIFPYNYSKSSAVFSLDVSKVTLTSENKKYFLYLLLKKNQKSIASAYSSGTGVKHFVETKFVKNYMIIKPPEELLDRFHAIVKPLFSKLSVNEKQIVALDRFRDVIHTSLILGKLVVNNQGMVRLYETHC